MWGETAASSGIFGFLSYYPKLDECVGVDS